MLKEVFKQAVFDTSPEVLRHIRRPEINLAVWKNPLSAEAAAYLDGLDLPRLCAKFSCVNDYYYKIGGGSIDTNHITPDFVRNFLKPLPDKPGKKKLIAEIPELWRAFAAATGHDKIGLSLLCFKPRESLTYRGGWHADPGGRWGSITLAGKTGMLWRPDKSLPPDANRRQVEWGDVVPGREKAFIQRLRTRDLAVFKCNQYPNPLVHASPPASISRGYRLMMGLGD